MPPPTIATSYRGLIARFPRPCGGRGMRSSGTSQEVYRKRTSLQLAPRACPARWHSSCGSGCRQLKSPLGLTVPVSTSDPVSRQAGFAPLSQHPEAPGCCRFCRALLRHTFVDLGMSPLCESYVSAERLDEMEPFYPLHVYVCDQCFLVQLREYVSPAVLFTEYAYFSSYSDSWLEHARRYVTAMVDRFALGPHSYVVEVASNDGYLLQDFVRRGIPTLGIRSEEHTSELQSRSDLVCRLLLEKKN